MNYRHAFHAGSFADVLKHAVLCRVLMHLRDKPAAFRVIDTHAGAGRYDLTSNESRRGGEWQNGIGRLFDAKLPPAVAQLLAPYLDTVRSLNGTGALRTYPGSPALAQAFLRRQDRMIACELEPQAAHSLRRAFGNDERIKTIEIDGWAALSAYLPPVERRGLVLIDPAFEEEGDFARLAESLETARRKWASGTYILWYPIKGRPEADLLAKRLRRLALPKLLRAELIVSPLRDPSRLNGCGLILLNPPWTLERELAVLLPALADILGQDPKLDAKSGPRLDWLGSETNG